MIDSKEYERQEKRRLRRQERILASAESRLNKITASQTAISRELTPSPTPSPSTSTSEPLSLAEHYPASNDTRRRNYERSAVPSPSISAKLGQHRPIVQQLIEQEEEEQQQASSLNKYGFLNGKVPHLLLAYMLKRTSIRPKRLSDPVNRYWHLLHFVSMTWLGVLAVYEQAKIHGLNHVPNLVTNYNTQFVTDFPVFVYFVTLEFILRFGRSIYQPNFNSSDEAIFVKMTSQLPRPLQRPVYLIQIYGLLMHSIFKDLCIVVFMIGFTGIVLTITR